MQDITDFFSNEIAPRIYGQIDSILPEFDFKMTGKGWISQNTYRPDGRTGKSKFKVYIYQNTPSIINCFTSSPSMNLAKYIAERDGKEWIKAVQDLAVLAEVELPKDDNYTPKSENIISQDVVQYLNYLLLNTDDGAKVRQYLEKRGFTDLSKFGLFVGIDRITKYLQKKNYEAQDIAEALQLFNGFNGRENSHQLAIPILSEFGTPKGFILRTISEATPKYLFTSGYAKGKHLFNFRHRKPSRIILTEGQIDTLLGEQVVNATFFALGGSALTDDQLKQLSKYKNTPVITCFDDDKAGNECTIKTVKKLLKNGFTDVSGIANFDGCNDIAELIESRPDGAKVLQEIISRPTSAKEILFNAITPPDEFPPPTDTEYLQRVVSYSQDITDGFQRNIFLDFVMSKTNDVRTETIQAEIDRQRFEFTKAEKQKNLQISISEAQELAKKNKSSEAVELLQNAINENSFISPEKALKMPDVSEFVNLLINEPDRLKTGILNDIWTVPIGAISLIAGRPSHGKTTLMFNILLNQLELYPEKKFYFLSYEEPRQKLFLKMVTALVAKLYPDSANIENNGNYGVSDVEVLQYIKNPDRLDSDVIEWIGNAIGRMGQYINTGRLIITDTPFKAEELPSVLADIPSESVIYLDYIQKIPTEADKTGFEIGKHVSGILLNQIAIPKNVPIILGAQLNRTGAEHTTHARDMNVSSLRESGDYEQDANSILLLHNHKFNNDGEGDVMSVKIGKNRDGEANNSTEIQFFGRNRFVKNLENQYI
jgi:DNA primase catalytic core